MKLTARIGTLVFDTQGEPDFLIDPDGFQGWDDGVDMRRDQVAFAQAHGSFDLPGFLDTRVISLSGNALADSPAELLHLRSRLTGLLADGGKQRLTVDQETGTTWADVRLASQTKFVVRGGDGCTARFQIQFVAPDPRKYGEQHVVTGGLGDTLSSLHYGNFSAAPVYRLTGSIPAGYTIHGPDGRTVSITRPLTGAHVHTYQFSTGLFREDGVVIAGAVMNAQRWPIPGGQVVESYVSGVGTATIREEHNDTFI